MTGEARRAYAVIAIGSGTRTHVAACPAVFDIPIQERACALAVVRAFVTL